MINQYTTTDDIPASPPQVAVDSQKKRKRQPSCCCSNQNKCVVVGWTQLLQVFGRKLILEVFGSAGAVWGFSEAVGLRTSDTNWVWRPMALLVGIIFWARWITQFRRSVSLVTRRNSSSLNNGYPEDDANNRSIILSGLDGYDDDIEQQQYYGQQQTQQHPTLRRKFSRQGSLGEAETSSLVAHASTPIKLSSSALKTTPQQQQRHHATMMASPDGDGSVGTTTTEITGLNTPDSNTAEGHGGSYLDGLVNVLPRSLFSAVQQQPNLDGGIDGWGDEDKPPECSLRLLREG